MHRTRRIRSEESLGARNNFRKFEIFRKKEYNTSCRARRAVSENRSLTPRNRLWTAWRPYEVRKITLIVFRSLFQIYESYFELPLNLSRNRNGPEYVSLLVAKAL